MKWIKVEDMNLKEDMPCVVVAKGSRNTIELLYWNAHYKVWDGADGDDYCCDKEDVLFYIPFSDLPDIPEID